MFSSYVILTPPGTSLSLSFSEGKEKTAIKTLLGCNIDKVFHKWHSTIKVGLLQLLYTYELMNFSINLTRIKKKAEAIY